MSKGRLRKLLVKSRYQMKIIRRMAQVQGSHLQVLLRFDHRAEEVLGELWLRIEPHMRTGRMQQAGTASTICKLVMDGHQKLTRWCYGISCRGYSKSSEVGQFCRHPRPATRGGGHTALLKEPAQLPQQRPPTMSVS